MKKAHFLFRAVAFFLLFLVIGAGIYRYAGHHYKNVADWGEAGSVNVLLYKDKTYFLAGEIGDSGLSSKKFPKEEVMGEVKPESLLDPADAYVVWSVKEKTDFIIVAVDEDTELLYYLDGTDNPAETETPSSAS